MSDLLGLLAAMAPRGAEPVVPIDLEAVQAAAFADGVAAGRAAAAAEMAPAERRLAAAAAALEAACTIDGDALRPLVADVTGRIAEAVIMAEFARDPAVMARLVDAALAMVRPGEAATLRAHPATLAALAGHLHGVVTAADAALAADEIIVSGPEFVIETGLAARLAEIMEAMA